MSDGFKEMLDVAIERNIMEIKQPIEEEIRRIFSVSIKELNLVRKSELDDLVKDALKKMILERSSEIKALIKESLSKELMPEIGKSEPIISEPPMPVFEELMIKKEITTPFENVPFVSNVLPSLLGKKSIPSGLKDFMTGRTFMSKNQQFRGVAYFLSTHEHLAHFNVKDLRDAYEKADLKAHPNFGITARDNVKSGFFEVMPERKDGFVTWKITEKTKREFE